MRRKIVNSLTGTSLIFCILFTWLWIDSLENITVAVFPTDEPDSWHLYISNWEGRMQVSLNNSMTSLGTGVRRIDPTSINPKQIYFRGVFKAVDDWILDDENDYAVFGLSSGDGYTTLMLHHALLVIAFVIAPGIWAVSWKRRDKDSEKNSKKKKK